MRFLLFKIMHSIRTDKFTFHGNFRTDVFRSQQEHFSGQIVRDWKGTPSLIRQIQLKLSPPPFSSSSSSFIIIIFIINITIIILIIIIIIFNSFTIIIFITVIIIMIITIINFFRRNKIQRKNIQFSSWIFYPFLKMPMRRPLRVCRIVGGLHKT